MPDVTETSRRFFYGLSPQLLRGDRLYRVYVNESMTAGAYVAGQIYDEVSAPL